MRDTPRSLWPFSFFLRYKLLVTMECKNILTYQLNILFFCSLSLNFYDRNVRSVNGNVRWLNSGKSSFFVPISELLFFESILTILHVPSADFSFKKFSVMARCRRPLVMCDTSDELTHALLSSSIIVGCCIQPVCSSTPRLEITSAFRVWLTALISDSAVEVAILPWSVEHQHIRDVPR